MAFARYGHPQVEIPFDDPEAAMQFALHHSRTTGEPVEVHGAGRATVYRRPSWRDTQPAPEPPHDLPESEDA